MSSKFTPWFPGAVKPVKKGVYQRDLDGAVRFGRWDGARWYWSCDTIERATRAEAWSGWQTDARWRGLAKDPKA